LEAIFLEYRISFPASAMAGRDEDNVVIDRSGGEDTEGEV